METGKRLKCIGTKPFLLDPTHTWPIFFTKLNYAVTVCVLAELPLLI